MEKRNEKEELIRFQIWGIVAVLLSYMISNTIKNSSGGAIYEILL